MRDSYNNWRRNEQFKLKEKEEDFSIKENYNVENEVNDVTNNNSF